MKARLAAALFVFLVSGCKAKAGEPCTVQRDCSGDLICWCYAWNAYDCKPHKQICTTTAEATAACAKADGCLSDGNCEAPRRSELDPDAIPFCNATDDGCAKWDVCRVHGKCKMARRMCIAASDADCKRSEDCINHGDCTLEGESCVVKSDADCATSMGCKNDGKCKLGEYRYCVR